MLHSVREKKRGICGGDAAPTARANNVNLVLKRCEALFLTVTAVCHERIVGRR